MYPIAIITDTDCSLPAAVANRYRIAQVPITVQFGDETFYTGVDMDDEAVFARIDRGGKLPTTAAPAPGAFAKAYQNAFAQGAEEVLCFCVSSEVSATYSAALAARQEVDERRVTVVDTRMLSLPQGFMVLAAAEAIEGGASAGQAIAAAQETGKRTHLYAALSTLKYLAMSGRVGHLAAGMAALLDVRPILTVREGKLDMLEKVRTQRKAWGRVIELTAQASQGKRIARLGILHARARAAAAEFQKSLCAAIPCPPEILLAELTPGLSVHSGAGLVGVTLTVAE